MIAVGDGVFPAFGEPGKDAGLSAVLGGFVMAWPGFAFPPGGKPKDSQQLAPLVGLRPSGIGHAVVRAKMVGQAKPGHAE